MRLELDRYIDHLKSEGADVSAKAIGEYTGLSKRTLYKYLTREKGTAQIKFDTIARFLSFFRVNGLDLEPGDLFAEEYQLVGGDGVSLHSDFLTSRQARRRNSELLEKGSQAKWVRPNPQLSTY